MGWVPHQTLGQGCPLFLSSPERLCNPLMTLGGKGDQASAPVGIGLSTQVVRAQQGMGLLWGSASAYPTLSSGGYGLPYSTGKLPYGE